MKPAFTKANRYLFDPKAWSWSLPSGTTCPGAEQCLAFVDRETGQMTNGSKQVFKCYSAMTERYPSVRERYWANFYAVKGKRAEQVAQVLTDCFPKKATKVRIHSAGDFYSETYFLGWLAFIRSKPDVLFWAFTKSLPFWVDHINEIPANLMLQASYGGKYDDLIEKHKLKFAKVVWSKEEADQLGLQIDSDDSLAALQDKPFALLENFTRK